MKAKLQYEMKLASEETTLATWARTIKRSALQEMLVVASRPGILSFALGLPAQELFPHEALARAAAHVLATDRRSLQYGPPFEPLKEHIVELMKLRGVTCRKEQVFLTTGAQQGMSLLAHLLLNPGGEVIIEEVIYTGLQQVIQPFQPAILTVPTDLDNGMDVDAVEALLRNGAHPAFIYAIPDGHNPLAVNMSLRKRARLVELAQLYRVPIVEDDAYGFLCYDSVAVPPMRALDKQFVFYIGTFSKILAPALRVGWMIVPESLVSKLSIIKEASDIDTSTFTQRTISAYIDSGELHGRVEMLCREYAARRDAMLYALRKYFPDRARWREPASGLFVWVELQDSIDTGELLKIAVESQRVAFIPGGALSACGNHSNNCMRLNFSNCAPDQIEEGMKRLGQVLQDPRCWQPPVNH